MYKEDLAVNNIKGLICHENNLPTKQPDVQTNNRL